MLVASSKRPYSLRVQRPYCSELAQLQSAAALCVEMMSSVIGEARGAQCFFLVGYYFNIS